MNRNMMYDLLFNEKQMFSVRNRRYNRNGTQTGYSVEFRLNRDLDQASCDIILDWGYISNVSSISLYQNEVHIEGKFGEMEMSVNINYKDIKDDEFEVRIFGEDGSRTY